MKIVPVIVFAALSALASSAYALDSSSNQLNAPTAAVATQVWCCTTKPSHVVIVTNKEDKNVITPPMNSGLSSASVTCPHYAKDPNLPQEVMIGYSGYVTTKYHASGANYHSYDHLAAKCAYLKSSVSCQWVDAGTCPATTPQ